jgi:hypothetical protein
MRLAAQGSASVFDRIPLGQGAGGFPEAWLQNTLFRHLGALPVREIDPHIGEFIPVCAETEAGAEPADIVCVTRTGQLGLEETKLWRNPEARCAGAHGVHVASRLEALRNKAC